MYTDTIQNIVTIKCILRCFQKELKVICIRVFLGRIGIDRINMQRYAAILNYKTMNLPFKYLGFSIGDWHW